ncbi:MAG: hypothetical protein U5R31_05160 [Acidimicrobiia bacterium]|nr:hypothetical protein [Acidimicrobiia bacterium]
MATTAGSLTLRGVALEITRERHTPAKRGRRPAAVGAGGTDG